MSRILFFSVLCFFLSAAKSEGLLNDARDSTIRLAEKSDSVTNIGIQASFAGKNRKNILQKYPPYFDINANKLILRNKNAPFGQKVLRGSGLVLAAQAITVGLLFALPERTSNWDRSALGDFSSHFKDAFRKPPVIDGDKWYINYLGHPYQGSVYYNAYRSQGAKIWQASLFCLGHSMMWEYLVESGFEQPSMQDMIVTPIAGALLGELFHFASVRMSRNGFKWYEAAFVSVFNPMYAISNGFKSAGIKK